MDHEALELASSILGGMRFKQSRETVNRIVAIQPENEAKRRWLTEAFSHLGNIEKLRNYLAHQQTSPINEELDGAWEISLLFTSQSPAKALRFEFETDVVKAASNDINRIAQKISTNPDVKNLIDRLVQSVEPLVWNYKPSSLKTLVGNFNI